MPDKKQGWIQGQIEECKDAFGIKPKPDLVRVEVVRIKLTLWDAMNLLINLALASIPALIILGIIWAVVVRGILGI